MSSEECSFSTGGVFDISGGRVVVNYNRSEKEARETIKACEAAGGEATSARSGNSHADCVLR